MFPAALWRETWRTTNKRTESVGNQVFRFTRANWHILLFFIPLTALILLIYLIPISSTFYYAFKDPFSPDLSFGFKNFEKIESVIWPATWRTIVWTLCSIVPSTIIGFIAALIFQSKFRGKKLLITACILSYTIPLVIVAMSWMLMYQQHFGLINVLLQKLSIIQSPISFLSYDNALTSVIVARIWRAVPFAFITFYAAISSLSDELLEAAEVDGANAFQKLFWITIPQLRSVAAVVMIILTMWTFLVFDIIFAMTGGGPVDATRILPVLIYNELFAMNDIGTASALSVISILVLLILSSIYWKIFNEGDLE